MLCPILGRDARDLASLGRPLHDRRQWYTGYRPPSAHVGGLDARRRAPPSGARSGAIHRRDMGDPATKPYLARAVIELYWAAAFHWIAYGCQRKHGKHKE